MDTPTCQESKDLRPPGRNPLSGGPLPSSYLWSWARWLNGALSSSKFMLRSSAHDFAQRSSHESQSLKLDPCALDSHARSWCAMIFKIINSIWKIQMAWIWTGGRYYYDPQATTQKIVKRCNPLTAVPIFEWGQWLLYYINKKCLLFSSSWEPQILTTTWPFLGCLLFVTAIIHHCHLHGIVRTYTLKFSQATVAEVSYLHVSVVLLQNSSNQSGGKGPGDNGFLERFRYCKLTRLPIDSGMDPVNWLALRFRCVTYPSGLQYTRSQSQWSVPVIHFSAVNHESR